MFIYICIYVYIYIYIYIYIYNFACSLVGCRLDYAISTLVGISVKNMTRLQRLQSTLARVVTCNGDVSASPRLCRSFIGFLSSGA